MGIVFSSCGQHTAKPPITISDATLSSGKTEIVDDLENSSPVLKNPEPSNVQYFLDNTSNLDLMNYFAAASATGLGISGYKGFESPANISANGLMDFFVYASNSDDYYDTVTKKYIVSTAEINYFLRNYFEGVSFLPEEEVFFKDYYNAGSDEFVLPIFATRDVRGNPAITDRIDHGDGTLTIKAAIYDIDDSPELEGSSPIGQEILTIKIANSKTFFQQYLVEHYDTPIRN